MLSLFAFANSIMSQNNITTNDNPEVKQGETGKIVIVLTSPKDIRDYQFDMIFPEGIKYENCKEISGTDHTIRVEDVSSAHDGSRYRFVSASLTGSYLPTTGTGVLEINVSTPFEQPSGNHAAKLTGSNLPGSSPQISLSAGSSKENTYRSIKQDDYSFYIFVAENFVELYEDSTSIPGSKDKTNVRVKRTLSSKYWNTISLPFPMSKEQIESAFGEGVKLAEFDGCETSADYFTIKFKTISNDTIEANHPYLIKVPRDITKIEALAVPYDASTNPSKKVGDNTFYGTNTKIENLGSEAKPYLFLSNNKFYSAVGNTTMKAFRGYFDIWGLSNIIGNAKFGFSVDDEATNIDGIETDQYITEGVYDMQGRRMIVKDGDINNLPRGIYIVNGKKIVVK